MSASPSDPNPSEYHAPIWLRRSGFFLLSFIMVLAGAGIWLFNTTSGARLAAHMLTAASAGAIRLEGIEGHLAQHLYIDHVWIVGSDLHVHVEHLQLDWSLRRILDRHVAVKELQAELVDVRTLKSAQPAHAPASLELPFSLLIEHLELNRLRFGKYTSETARHAFDMPAQSTFEMLTGRVAIAEQYVATLSARTPWGNASVRGSLAARKPYALSAAADLAAALDTRPLNLSVHAMGRLERIKLAAEVSGRDIAGSGEGVLQPFAPMPVSELELNVKGFDPSAFAPTLPKARLDVQAHLQPEGQPARDTKDTLLSRWPVSGRIAVNNAIPAPIDQQGIPLATLTANMRWADETLTVNEFVARFPAAVNSPGRNPAGKNVAANSPPGEIRGSARLSLEPDSGSHAWGRFNAQLQLREIDPARIHSGIRSDKLQGMLTVEGNRSEQDFTADLKAQRYAVALQGKYRHDPAERIEIAQARLSAGAATLDASGRMELSGARNFAFEGKLRHFDPGIFLAQTPRADISAHLAVLGQLQPQLLAKVDLQLDPSGYDGYPVRGGGHFTLTANSIRDADLSLDVLGNRLSVQGTLGALPAFGGTAASQMVESKTAPADRFSLQLDAPHLERLGNGMAGSMQASAQLQGDWSHLAGSAHAQLGKLRMPGDYAVESATLDVELGVGRAGVFNIRVDARQLALGSRDENLAVHALQLSTQGTRAAHVLKAAMQLGMEQSLTASMQGGFNEPAADEPVQWLGRVEQLTAQGPINFHQIKPAKLEISPQRIVLAPTELRATNALLMLERTMWTPERIELTGRMSGMRVGVSLDEFQRPVLRGRTLQLGGEWNLVLAQQANGFVRLQREAGDIVLEGDAPVALGLKDALLTLVASDNRLAFAFSASGEHIGTVSAAATALSERVGSRFRLVPDAPLVGSATVAIPSIAWMGPLISQDLQTAGSLDGEFSLAGTPGKPESSGRIKGDKLAFAMADEGLRLSGGTMTMEFDRERVRIAQFNFISPNIVTPREKRIDLTMLTREPGRLNAQGEFLLATGQASFSFEADRLPLLQREDQWMMISGRGRADSTGDKMQFSADLRSDAAFFELGRERRPALSDDVVIVGQKTKPARNLQITADVNFDLGRASYLRVSGIDTRLGGALRFALAPRQPLRAYGTVRPIRGVFDAYNQKLSITSGAVTFQGALDNPSLNVVAVRKGLEVEAGVEVSGTLQNPKVRLVSDPPVPDAEKLSWIVLGRAPESGSGGDAAILVSAASAVFGGNGESVTKRIAQSVGLDDISIAQSSGGERALTSQVAGGGRSSTGASNVSAQVLSVGKRLTSQAYLSFEQSLSGAESLVKLTYALSRRLSVVARGGTENALDMYYSVSFP